MKTPTLKSEATNGASPRIDCRDKLSPEDLSFYLDLKDWRKVRAEKEGTKVFAVFTNVELAAIAEQKRCDTKAALAEISRVRGSAKEAIA